jgi:acetyl-CoA carboxylase carboxyl transferase subunit alpha
VTEPIGGAHRDHGLATASLANAILAEIKALRPLKPNELRQKRREKFLQMGLI